MTTTEAKKLVSAALEQFFAGYKDDEDHGECDEVLAAFGEYLQEFGEDHQSTE